jgi:hypothetical protein
MLVSTTDQRPTCTLLERFLMAATMRGEIDLVMKGESE